MSSIRQAWRHLAKQRLIWRPKINHHNLRQLTYSATADFSKFSSNSVLAKIGNESSIIRFLTQKLPKLARILKPRKLPPLRPGGKDFFIIRSTNPFFFYSLKQSSL